MQGFFISTPLRTPVLPFGTFRMPLGVLRMPLGTFRPPSGTTGMAPGVVGMSLGVVGMPSGILGMPSGTFRPPSYHSDPRPNVPTRVGMLFLYLYFYFNLLICSRLNQFLLQNQKSIKFVVFFLMRLQNLQKNTLIRLPEIYLRNSLKLLKLIDLPRAAKKLRRQFEILS